VARKATSLREKDCPTQRRSWVSGLLITICSMDWQRRPILQRALHCLAAADGAVVLNKVNPVALSAARN
jgi:hypothetical protein